jgi:membrane protease YdiL (CAAX protease family)
MLLLVAPVLEEAVFRAGLQDGLTRSRLALSPLAAALWTALAFGLVHAWARQDLMALGVALPALSLGLVYNRWHRLRWCVLLHAGMNALWLAFVSWAPLANA